MDRVFDYENARRLYASHKQILDTIQAVFASRTKDEDRVKKAAKDVFNSKVIASQISTALSSGNINVAMQPNELALLREVYVCSEGERINAVLNNWEQVRRQILRDMSTISSVNSSLKWFFAGKQTKEEANAAYERLAQLLQEDYPAIVKKQADRSRELDALSVKDAFGKISGQESSYLQCLNRCVPNLATQDNLTSDISKTIQKIREILGQYQSARDQQKGKEASARLSADLAIKPLIMERTLEELRNQDIEVLSQKRSGIRIKALRDRGYRNIADVYVASPYQLASVYGISADTAKVIKVAANEIAQDVSRTIKLKISSDDRTPAATALLKAAYRYDCIRKAGRAITPEIQKQLEDLENQATYLTGLKNNLSWVFASPTKQQRYVDAYQSLEKGLMSGNLRIIQDYCNEIIGYREGAAPTDTWVWKDFTERSIEYFNLLEDLCPGLFGNDDVLYGLPEELAREIQDQVYFPQGLKVDLRRYQEWGVKYILHQGRVLLGDEMGLGKTVQAIATMVSLRNTGARKFLVVCPASVLPNWCKEIDKKSEFRSIKVHGYGRQAAFDAWNSRGGVAVTTYETLSTLTIPAGLEYDLLVVDEAHFIKNENAQRSQNVRMYGTFAKRILFMTGTALENRVEEMLSLLQVLNPKVASQAQRIAFMSTAPQFRQLIAPVYYRRKREDVLTELPAITRSNEWCDLMPEEYAAYKRAVLAKDQSAIRKVSWVTPDLNKSAKARRLKEIVEEAASDGRKVLVFSFYLETIERVQELFGRQCSQPINGRVSTYRRQEIIDEFEKMPAGSVLPAQIIAGGTGLNIQSASVVIFCEPQLKPSIENQAMSRAYRMGQTRKVLVYRLLASDTIDERIEDLLTEKQAIFDAFADISEAASATKKEDQQIDDKTFGKLIQEEIDRINRENGTTTSPQSSRQPEQTRSQPAQQKTTPEQSRPQATQQNTMLERPRSQPAQQKTTPEQQTVPVVQAEPVRRPVNPTRPVVATRLQSHPISAPIYWERPRTAVPTIEYTPTIQVPSSAKSSIFGQREQSTAGASQNMGRTRARPATSAYKDQPMISMPPARSVQSESRPAASTKERTGSQFTRLEDFIMYANGNGIVVKDNRDKGGCLWIKADPRIDEVIKKQIFGDRGFRYSAKSKALGGEPGWYY